MRFFRTSLVMGLLLCLTMISGVMGGANPFLKEVPSGAALVIVTGPLSEFSAKIDQFARQIGVPMEKPFNAGEMLSGQMGIGAAIDGSRGVAVAVRDLTMLEETAMVFVPVTDGAAAKTMLAQGTASPVADVYQTTDGVFAKAMGNYIIIAPKAETLGNLAGPKGVVLSPADLVMFEQSDIAAVVNLDGVMPMFKGLMGGLLEKPELQQYPALKTLLAMAIDRVGESKAVSLGVKLGADGINLALGYQTAPGSVLGKYLVKQPTTSVKALANMPTTDFVGASTAKHDPAGFIAVINAVTEVLINDAKMKEKLNPADVTQLKDLLTKVLTQSTGSTTAIYMPPATPGQTGMVFSSVAEYENAAKTMELMEPMCTTATKVIQQAGYQLPISYNKNAGTMDGLTYQEINIDFSQLPLPQDMMQAMAMMHGGKAAISEQFCLVKGDMVAVGMGEGGLKNAIALIKNGPTGLDKDPGVVKAAANLPKEANMLGFVNVGKYIQFAVGMATAQAAQQNPQQAQMMAGMAAMFGSIQGTVGAAVTTQDGGARVEIFVPTETIQSGVQMGMMMMGGMMGGGSCQPGTAPQGQEPPPAPKEGKPAGTF